MSIHCAKPLLSIPDTFLHTVFAYTINLDEQYSFNTAGLPPLAWQDRPLCSKWFDWLALNIDLRMPYINAEPSVKFIDACASESNNRHNPHRFFQAGYDSPAVKTAAITHDLPYALQWSERLGTTPKQQRFLGLLNRWGNFQGIEAHYQ